jgi:hypothetical protein
MLTIKSMQVLYKESAIMESLVTHVHFYLQRKLKLD